MINELKDVGHEITNAQKVQIVIHSLPSNWEHVYANLTYNDNIKIFDDVAHHVELEENRLHAEKPVNKAFISETNMCGLYDFKYKKGKSKGPKYGKKVIKASSSGYKRKRGKHDCKKNENIDCFNYGKPGHFASDCSKPNVIFNHNHPFNLYVSS
jgi:hypothetical protein